MEISIKNYNQLIKESSNLINEIAGYIEIFPEGSPMREYFIEIYRFVQDKDSELFNKCITQNIEI